jgi:hypothetical protein
MKTNAAYHTHLKFAGHKYSKLSIIWSNGGRGEKGHRKPKTMVKRKAVKT